MTSAAAIPTVTLNDDNTMPVLGLGVAALSLGELWWERSHSGQAGA